MVKKRSVKKNVEEEGEYMNKSCCHGFILMKLSVVAFLLFLLTVWPWLRGVLLGIHWGIYLAIVLLLMIFAMTKYCKKK